MRHVFVIRDRKAQVFHDPFFEIHKVQAMRAFEKACRSTESAFSTYPDDYELLYLGTFDQTKGSFDFLKFPEVLGAPRDFMGPGAPQAEKQAVNQ